MIRVVKRPDLLALLVSLVGSLAVFLGFLFGLFSARQEDLGNAGRSVHQLGTMLAEHAARTLDGIDVLLLEVSRDLSKNRSDWRDWPPEKGWDYVSERHTKSMPQLRELIVFDQNGEQRFQSTRFPPNTLNVHDRTYFQALESGAQAASYGPYIGRNSGRYSFGIGRRIVGVDGRFSGIAFAALELAYFHEFCWPIRLHDTFDAVLINTSGQVVASCRPVDLSPQSTVIGRRVGEILLGGQIREIELTPGESRQQEALVSVVALPSHPELRIVAMLPESAALQLWERRAVELTLFAAIVVVILISGGWLVRHQIIELAAKSAELNASRDDLEDRVRAATEEIEGQKEEAIRNSTAKSRFLAAASHDLRQPLHALSLFAADLQRQINSGYTRDIDQLATQINTSVNSLTEMLDALLDISRLDMGGVQPDVSDFAVQAVFDRLHVSFRRAAMNKRIILKIARTRLYMRSDLHLVERLLGNLISNAIRYTPEGGKVLVAARRRADKVQIEVRDNGLGIAPEHQQMIFKEFFQVGNVARDQKQGLGLGLAIVQRLLRTLDAQLDLRSRHGAGTLFSIRLPRCAPPAIEPVTMTRLALVGDAPHAAHLLELAGNWGLACERYSDLPDFLSRRGEQPAIVVAPAEWAGELRSRLPITWPLAALGSEGVPEGVFSIQTPIRPAKLRALLQQLQNTLSKSML